MVLSSMETRAHVTCNSLNAVQSTVLARRNEYWNIDRIVLEIEQKEQLIPPEFV